MNKSQLAELYQKRNWPVAEFVSSSAFKSLEAEPESVEALEKFMIPEVIRLICCSDKLMEHAWAAHYKDIRPLYLNPSFMDVKALVENYSDSLEFKERILDYADSKMLGDIKRYFEGVKKDRRNCALRKSDLKKKSDQLKSAGDSSEEVEKELQQVQETHKELDRYIKSTKKHQEYLQQAIDCNTEELVEKRRAEAYDSIFSAVPAEELFLKQFIQKGCLTEETKNQVQDESFFLKLLQSLDKVAYCDFAIPVIMKLFELGVIDLEMEAIHHFLTRHASSVCCYISECLSNILYDDCDERALLDAILRIECEHSAKQNISIFHELWDTIQDADTWLSLLKYAVDIDLPNFNEAIIALVNGLDATASEALAEALFAPEIQEMHINPIEAISEALTRQAKVSDRIIITAFRAMEQISRSAQRKLRAADRKMNGQAKNLFSAVYLPVERLETFAIDMRMSKGNIPCQLVANQLVDIAADLRSGMLQLDLAPVCDIEDWRRGYPVPFDPENHRKPMAVENVPEKVILQTMGFRYRGDNDQLQQYSAQIVPVIPKANEPCPASDESFGADESIKHGKQRHRYPHKLSTMERRNP